MATQRTLDPSFVGSNPTSPASFIPVSWCNQSEDKKLK